MTTTAFTTGTSTTVDRNHADKWSIGSSRSPLYLKGKQIWDVHVLSDQSSLEIFTDKYRNNHSNNIYAGNDQNQIIIQAYGGLAYIEAYKSYGTGRINAYEIIEKTLNLKDVKIFDTETNANGEKVRVFNAKETAIAQAKQDQIKQAFEDWIFNDQERRERLVRLYNDKFNSIRPREYDGSHLTFPAPNLVS